MGMDELGEFEEVSWEEIKRKGLDVLATDKLKREILIKAGYQIDGEGYLVDGKTNQRVRAEDGLKINLDKNKEVGVVAGSHIFVRNVAGYAHVLTGKGLVKVETDIGE